MPTRVRYNSKKFREMVLYFAEVSHDDRLFGLTRLNKQAWAADFLAYRVLGAPITGAKYVHREFGPAPKRMLIERDRLISEGDLEIEDRATPLGAQKHPVAKRGADASVFSRDEINIMDSIVDSFRGKSATFVSEWSHQLPAWLLTLDGEEIPYCMAYMWQDEDVGLADLRWAVSELKRLAIRAA